MQRAEAPGCYWAPKKGLQLLGLRRMGPVGPDSLWLLLGLTFGIHFGPAKSERPAPELSHSPRLLVPQARAFPSNATACKSPFFEKTIEQFPMRSIMREASRNATGCKSQVQLFATGSTCVEAVIRSRCSHPMVGFLDVNSSRGGQPAE